MRALVCELSVPRQVVTSLLGRIDKRFFFGPFSPATLRELPEPELPAPDWVTIRTRLCGICGSDYKQMFLNGSMDNPMTAVISFPQVLGHELPPVPGGRARPAGGARRPVLGVAARHLEPPARPGCKGTRLRLRHARSPRHRDPARPLPRDPRARRRALCAPAGARRALRR